MKKWSDSRAPAGRIAYVNGRYLRHGQAGVHIEDRGLQLGEAIYEVCNVRGRPADRRGAASRPAGTVAERNRHGRCRWARAALKLVMRELMASNRIAERACFISR